MSSSRERGTPCLLYTSPCTPEAVEVIQGSGLLFAPAKAANAGGVAVSALEMSQNSMRFSWTFEEVDQRLKTIMDDLYRNASNAAAQYGMAGDLVAGANICLLYTSRCV